VGCEADDADGSGAFDGEPGLILVAAGLLSAGLGAAIVTTPAYRPDLGDHAVEFDPYGAKTRKVERRNWWTGDRR